MSKKLETLSLKIQDKGDESEENNEENIIEEEIEQEGEQEEVEAEEVEGEEIEDQDQQKEIKVNQEEDNDEEEIEIISEKKEKKEIKLKGDKKGGSIKRRESLYKGFDENQSLFRPEFRFNNDDPVKEKMWELMDTYLPRDKLNVQKSILFKYRIFIGKTSSKCFSMFRFRKML